MGTIISKFDEHDDNDSYSSNDRTLLSRNSDHEHSSCSTSSTSYSSAANTGNQSSSNSRGAPLTSSSSSRHSGLLLYTHSEDDTNVDDNDGLDQDSNYDHHHVNNNIVNVKGHGNKQQSNQNNESQQQQQQQQQLSLRENVRHHFSFTSLRNIVANDGDNVSREDKDGSDNPDGPSKAECDDNDPVHDQKSTSSTISSKNSIDSNNNSSTTSHKTNTSTNSQSSSLSFRSFFAKSGGLYDTDNDDNDDDDDGVDNTYHNGTRSSKNNIRSLSNSSLFLSNKSLQSHNSSTSTSSSNSNSHTIIYNKINNISYQYITPPTLSYSSTSSAFPKAQKMITSQQNLIMGPSPPPIYEMALIGQWKELMKRVHYYPKEVLYRDKCNNTALHLVCRRQPPTDVVRCLLDVLWGLNDDDDIGVDSSNINIFGSSFDHNKSSNIGKILTKRRRCCFLGGVTTDGLTPLHFAAYCGASPDVIELLLRYENDALLKQNAKKEANDNGNVHNDDVGSNFNIRSTIGRRSTNGGCRNYTGSTNNDETGIELELGETEQEGVDFEQNETEEALIVNGVRRGHKEKRRGSMVVPGVGVDDYDNQFSNHSNSLYCRDGSLYSQDGRYNNNTLPQSSRSENDHDQKEGNDGNILNSSQMVLPFSQSTSAHSLSSSSSSSSSSATTTSSSSPYEVSNKKYQHTPTNSKVGFKLPLDRRGRTALHSICAGFRTGSRPLNIYLLLSYDPTSVLLEDEKCKTALSLMYDDYAEEIDELLSVSFPPSTMTINDAASSSTTTISRRTSDDESMETMLFCEKGSMNECWKILVLLLKAVYLGSVVDDGSDVYFGRASNQQTIKRQLKGKDKGYDIDDENRSSCSECSGSVSNDSSYTDNGDNAFNKRDSNNGINSDSSSAILTAGRHLVRRKNVKKRSKQRKRSTSSSDLLDKTDDLSAFSPTNPVISQSRYEPNNYNEHGRNGGSTTTDEMTSSPETTDESNDNPRPFSKSGHSLSTTTRKKSLTFFPNHVSNSSEQLNDLLSLPPLLDESTPLTPALLSFSLIHAAASIPYTCPYGFFQLLLKVSPDKVREFDDGHHSKCKNGKAKRKRHHRRSTAAKGLGSLPLHLATKSLPPLSSWFGRHGERYKGPALPTKSQQNLSTSFHGYASILYQDPSSDIVISYHSQSKSKQNKQYHTASFVQPPISSSMTMSTWDSIGTASCTSYLSRINSSPMIPTPIISHLIDAYPEAAGIPEPSSGKYPIELAIESGKCYFSVIAPLVNAFPCILYPSRHIEQNGNCDVELVGIERIYTSLSTALMNPSMQIRNEAAITVGCIIRKVSGFIESVNDAECNIMRDFYNENGGGLLNPSEIEPKSFKVEEFVLQLIRSSDGSMNMGNVNDDPYSNAHFMTDDEWGSVQSTTLKALSNAFKNASPKMLSDSGETPKKALTAAENMIRHDDVAVRESAASVLGTVLNWLRTSDASSLLHRFVISDSSKDNSAGRIKGNRKKYDILTDDPKLSSSMHSMFSLASSSSSKTLKTSNVRSKLRHSLPTNSYKMLQSEWAHIKHGKALAFLRLLISNKGKQLVSEGMINFTDVAHVMKGMMLDDDIEVRKAACLTIGAVLGRSATEVETLKIMRHSILKCMRVSEEEEVQVALARGLMLATHLKPHIFVCKAGTPVLECAMILGVTSQPTVQKIFYAFLWLALGVGDKDSTQSGLSHYLELAEGENGLIMMNLVAKELEKIKSIEDVLWQ